MLRIHSQITIATLALLVAVLSVAAPWCAVPVCPQMLSEAAGSGMAACVAMPVSQLSAPCGDMSTPAGPASAVATAKAPPVPDVTAVTVDGIELTAVTAVPAVYAPPMDDPPRLVLDTSRLRI